MAAMAGASGARSWLQAHHLGWLTPRRLRAMTIAMFVAAFGVSSVGISGSAAVGHTRSSAPGDLHAGASVLSSRAASR